MEIPLKRKYRVRKITQDGYKAPKGNGGSGSHRNKQKRRHEHDYVFGSRVKVMTPDFHLHMVAGNPTDYVRDQEQVRPR